MPEDPDAPGSGRGNYPHKYRRRADFFYAAWAHSHNMTIMAARMDPAAQGYYQESYGRGRYRAARAWAAAGVIEFHEDTGEWDYTDEYK